MLLSLPWIAIFLAAPATWAPALQWLGLTLLALGYSAALTLGQVDAMAGIAIALLALAAYTVAPHHHRAVRAAGHALFVALAIALTLHWMPGFHNPRVTGPVRLTPDALPFTMYLNLDKPLVGFWLLLVIPWIRRPHGWRNSLTAGVTCLLLTTLACLALAMLLGVVRWAPKLPADSALWLLNNLLLVTLAEEALFRGYLQGGLTRLLRRRPHADLIALGVAAVLFGLAHAQGGWHWVLLATVAGVGYGFAYRQGGLPAAILAHVGLNAAQFFFFTYPMLEAASGH
jgi:uncharacterized protein